MNRSKLALAGLAEPQSETLAIQEKRGRVFLLQIDHPAWILFWCLEKVGSSSEGDRQGLNCATCVGCFYLVG